MARKLLTKDVKKYHVGQKFNIHFAYLYLDRRALFLIFNFPSDMFIFISPFFLLSGVIVIASL